MPREVFLSNAYQLQPPANRNHALKTLSLKLRAREGESAALTGGLLDVYLIAFQAELTTRIYSRQFRESVSILHGKPNARLI